MKAIILARVSDEKQDSNEAQVMRVMDYVRNKKLEVWKTYEIKESSTQGSRKQFKEIIGEIEKSKETIALVADTVDRIQRSFRDSITLDDLRKAGKLEIHFYRENLVLHKDSNSSELIRWDMAVMFARSYVLQLSDNVKRKLEAMKKNGEWITKPPLGYKSVYASDEDKERRRRKDIIPDPETAPLIKKMFELYAGGTSVKLLSETMGKMGLNGTRNKKGIRPNVVYNCLTNPFYYGVMRSNGVLTPHKYQPLISKQLFLKCRQKMDDYHKKPFAYGSKPFALKGLIKCADPRCGCTITAEGHEGDHVYYSCTNYKNVHSKRIYVKSEELLRPIKKVISKLYMPEDKIEETVKQLRELNESKNKFYEESMATLRKEHDHYSNRISNLFDLLADGDIEKDLFTKKMQEYKNKQYEIELKMSQFTMADEDFYLNASMLLNLVRRSAEIFENSEPEVKRQILNFLLQNAELDGKRLKFTLKKPFDGLLHTQRYMSWRGQGDLNP